ncbi:bile salt-activated lipase-like [Xiphias gladius]|uniref:bile salt-activated lipase-like n=1 Tax=Xiphias gladius TaxID=8245 RepID=UPI001A99C0C8|nr:bile salt-activated lipase-like [Xiphias gladius]
MACLNEYFLTDEPHNLFHNADDIDCITGVNNVDGHVITGLDVPSINFPLDDTPIRDVKKLLASYTKRKGEAGLDNAYSAYTSTWGKNPSRQTVKKTILDIGTDYIFLVPTKAALYLHAANTTTGRTCSYLFSESNRLAGFRRLYPTWLGADRADDLQYVFGKPFTLLLGHWPRHHDISTYMVSYWTNFARTGDLTSTPSSTFGMNWNTDSEPDLINPTSALDPTKALLAEWDQTPLGPGSNILQGAFPEDRIAVGSEPPDRPWVWLKQGGAPRPQGARVQRTTPG